MCRCSSGKCEMIYVCWMYDLIVYWYPFYISTLSSSSCFSWTRYRACCKHTITCRTNHMSDNAPDFLFFLKKSSYRCWEKLSPPTVLWWFLHHQFYYHHRVSAVQVRKEAFDWIIVVQVIAVHLKTFLFLILEKGLISK